MHGVQHCPDANLRNSCLWPNIFWEKNPQRSVAEVTWISTCEWMWPSKKIDPTPNCQTKVVVQKWGIPVDAGYTSSIFWHHYCKYNLFLKIIGGAIALDSTSISSSLATVRPRKMSVDFQSAGQNSRWQLSTPFNQNIVNTKKHSGYGSKIWSTLDVYILGMDSNTPRWENHRSRGQSRSAIVIQQGLYLSNTWIVYRMSWACLLVDTSPATELRTDSRTF